MKTFIIGFALLTNFATAGVITSNNIYWQGDNRIIGTAYGMDKSVDLAKQDALDAIYTGLRPIKDLPMIKYCLEGGKVLSDGTCPSYGPVVVALPITK